ncbi:MAG: hypothetical protein A2W90_16510 [Bacteroidetes bacterium GWF2_42_66]|nr:MAG: hypothetical protein A2W92_04105 [Bacteroidetes bacterium GWA2_42_15]OFX96296.1 MAG: hypothetical protein A2W89_05440 [Bacteroidetes bacterium GWE2_42_39]OFY46335.1 MAG: hypothetical protein A2W90_16510 [Bacteroidetes bacterium GWF2_42_66]HAZ03455.1 hypothetical protein [Marinilabiliales bacterium]HBL78279.1 hypothetical protein [Prolixibacteraceae bacterium]
MTSCFAPQYGILVKNYKITNDEFPIFNNESKITNIEMNSRLVIVWRTMKWGNRMTVLPRRGMILIAGDEV